MPMLLREPAEAGDFFRVRKVASVFLGLEQHELDIVHQWGEVLNVGHDAVGDDVRGGADAEKGRYSSSRYSSAMCRSSSAFWLQRSAMFSRRSMMAFS